MFRIQRTAQERGDAQIRRLLIARLVLAPLGFGMMVAAGVNLLTAIPRLFSGSPGSFMNVVPMFVVASVVVAISVAAIPRIDRRILELARESAGDTCGPELLKMVTGLPLFSNRNEIEMELARRLSAVDEDWWDLHSGELKEQVHAAFELARHRSWLHPTEGPWIPALLDAIGRCGRTEYIRQVEALLRRSSRDTPQSVLAAATSTLESLQLRQKRDREEATLLRPSLATNETLLRTVERAGSANSETLLRPDERPRDAGDMHLSPGSDSGARYQSTVSSDGEPGQSISLNSD